MSKTKHTPGPWLIRYERPDKPEHTRSIYRKGGGNVAFLYGRKKDTDDRDPTPEEEAELNANAMLISSAPVMLAALEKIESELIELEIDIPDYLTEAIAKAKGES